FSSTSLTGARVREANKSSRLDSKTPLRCRTMSTGRGKSAGSAARKLRITCKLPAEPPMTTSLTGFMHLPPYFFFSYLPVTIGNGGKAKGLLGSHGQIAEVFQAVIK